MSQRIPGIDHELVRQLARDEVDAGLTKAPEIGRRVARTLDSMAQDGSQDADESRRVAYLTLVGLAGLGATNYAKTILREHSIQITRRNGIMTISTGWKVPDSVAENGIADETELTLDPDHDARPSRRRQTGHVQFGFMSWPEFHLIWRQLQTARDSLDASVVTFEEIAKLEPLYPDLTVGEAMERAGLDPDLGTLDLDRFFNNGDPDLGAHEADG